MSATSLNKTKVSNLHSHLGFWLRFVSNHVSHEFSRRLVASGVTVAEWVVLRQMYDRREVSASVLAEELDMTRGAASKLVDRLLAKDLLTRKERSDDRRFQSLTLTPSGRRLVPELAAIADENDREFFAPLTAKDREALVAIMKKLTQAHNLRKLPTE